MYIKTLARLGNILRVAIIIKENFKLSKRIIYHLPYGKKVLEILARNV